ncbi:FixH family protein [Metabacillus niabensis]|uniref:FixH family protein n=1 Tax=Metabacillus niabensis TaxID=324854 RepID=UPI00399FA39C
MGTRRKEGRIDNVKFTFSRFAQKLMVIHVSLLLVGCSHIVQDHQKIEEKPKKLEVRLESNPTQVHVNEKLIITSNITYGNEKISKGAEVMFEVIENGVSYGNLPVKPSNNGEYQLELKFMEPGQHQVISHVSYKNLHEMPYLNFQVTE